MPTSEWSATDRYARETGAFLQDIHGARQLPHGKHCECREPVNGCALASAAVYRKLGNHSPGTCRNVGFCLIEHGISQGAHFLTPSRSQLTSLWGWAAKNRQLESGPLMRVPARSLTAGRPSEPVCERVMSAIIIAGISLDCPRNGSQSAAHFAPT